MLERVVTDPLDGIEYGEPATAKHLDIHAQSGIDALCQWQTLCEQFPRPPYQILHQRNITHIKAATHNVGFGEPVGSEGLKWDVDPALLDVAIDILPKIRKLQGSAGCIGEPLALRIAI